MGNIINTLATLIKMLADLFKFPSLAPAMLFVALNQLFILPHFDSLPLVHAFRARELSDQVLVGFVIAVFLGYFINAIEVPIVKFYEGYSWKDTKFGQWLVKKQCNRREQLEKQKPTEVDIFFPYPAYVLPTKLGNIMAAFEAYPRNKYYIDGVVSWSRIFPILVKHEFMPYIDERRSTLDFLLNNSLLLAIFGLECLLLRIVSCQGIHYILPLVALVSSFFFYLASITTAAQWGELFCAAFDLFRYQLAKALGLRCVESFREERLMWKHMTSFWREKPNFNFKEFNYDESAWPVDNFEHRENAQ
ncbi:MAG: hypothetical protein D3906_02570 [Candidatus Electrothrix sp. AUS1_2]|nr:hypothetical protein [Candidatus Electrothrix sp. AUS1_2]